MAWCARHACRAPLGRAVRAGGTRSALRGPERGVRRLGGERPGRARVAARARRARRGCARGARRALDAPFLFRERPRVARVARRGRLERGEEAARARRAPRAPALRGGGAWCARRAGDAPESLGEGADGAGLAPGRAGGGGDAPGRARRALEPAGVRPGAPRGARALHVGVRGGVQREGHANAPRAASPARRASIVSARVRSTPSRSARASIALGSRGNGPPNALFARSSVSSVVCVRSPRLGIGPSSVLSRTSSTRRLGSAANNAAGSVPFRPLPRACRCVSASRLAPATPSASGKAPNAPTPETFSRFKRAIGRIARDDKGPVIFALPSTRSDLRSSKRLFPSQSSNGPASAFPSSRKNASVSRSPSHGGIAPVMPLFASESDVKPPTRSSAAGNAGNALDDRSSWSRCAAKEKSSSAAVSVCVSARVSFESSNASGNASTPSNPFRARYSFRSDGSARRDDGTSPLRLFRDSDRWRRWAGQRNSRVSAGISPEKKLCDRSSSTRLGSAKSDAGMGPSAPMPRRRRCVSRVNFASVSFDGNEKEGV